MQKQAKIIMVLGMVLLLVSFTNANLRDDLLWYYNFTSDAKDSAGSIDGTLIDVPTHISSNGIIDGYYRFDGTNDMIHFDNTLNSIYDNSDGITWNLWVNRTNDQGSADDFLSMGTSTNDNGINPFGAYTTDPKRLEIFLRDTSNNVRINTQSTKNVFTSNWTMVTFVVSDSGGTATWYLYVNGVQSDTSTYTDSAFSFTKTALGGLRRSSGNANFMKVDLDEFGIWNRTLSQPEIQAMFEMYRDDNKNPITNGTGGGGGGSPPTLTLNTDIVAGANISQNDLPYSYNINGTMTNVTNSTFLCSFSYNSFFYNTSNINMSQNTRIGVNLTGIAGLDIDIYANCTNSETEANFSKRIWADTVNPVVTSETVVNNSIRYRFMDSYIFNATFFDYQLLQVNMSVCVTDGENCTVSLRHLNKTGLGTDSRNLTLTTFNSDYADDANEYMLRLEAWDGHTTIHIPDYPWEKYSLEYGGKTYKGISFKNNYFNMSTDDYALVDDFALIKRQDRFQFGFNFNTINQPIDLFIASKKDIMYLPTSEYPGHFVVGMKHWIDFDSPDVTDLTITYLEQFGLWRIRFTPTKKIVVFNSVGDLNYVVENYYFNMTTPQYIHARDAITNVSISNYTVKVFTYPSTTVQEKSTTNGVIYFNITSGTYYLNTSSNNYVSNTTSNYTFSSGGNLTIYMTAANSLYLFIYDEQNNTLIDDRNVTIDIINYQNVSSTYTTETGSTFQSGFAPGVYEINYKANSYTPRSYYTTITGSDTQTINLYLLLDNDQDSDHQYVNYDIVDESASALSNSTLKMQRYYLADNVWRTVEMSISNDQGQGFVFAELYDTPYRFIVEYPFGTTKKISSQAKLDSRALLFSISLLDVGLTNYYSSGNVATTLSYSNTTKVWTYSFNAASLSDVESGRFQVDKITPTVTTTICNSTVSSNSGGMTCNLTAYSNDDSTFVALGFVTFASDSLEYLVESASQKVTANHLKYGLDGVYMSLMAIGTMAFMGLFSPPIAILMILFGLVITNLLGLLYMNATWLISIIIVGLIYIYSLKD